MATETLTAEQIDKMEVGRELDALIAEHVMGWYRWDDQSGNDYDGPEDRWFFTANEPNWLAVYDPNGDGNVDLFFAPSREMGDTWRVVKHISHLRPEGYNLHLIHYAYNRTYACFNNRGFQDDTTGEGDGENSTQLAICRAALKAVLALHPPTA